MTSIKNAVGTIISRNARVAIWVQDKDDDCSLTKVWQGMAWGIPDKYMNRGDWKIFGTVVEDIMDSDVVNIEVRGLKK